MIDKVKAGVPVRGRHLDDLGPVAAQEQVGVQIRQVAGGEDNQVAVLHQFALPGPAQQGDQSRAVRLAHGPQVHRGDDGFGVFQDQGQWFAGWRWQGAAMTRSASCRTSRGLWGRGLGAGFCPRARKARARTRETSSASSASAAISWAGLQGLAEGVFADLVPELQTQAEIVEDYLAGLGQPMAQKMAERQVIAIHPGIIEDLPMQDKEGRFTLLEVRRQFLGPCGKLLPGPHNGPLRLKGGEGERPGSEEPPRAASPHLISVRRFLVSAKGHQSGCLRGVSPGAGYSNGSIIF